MDKDKKEISIEELQLEMLDSYFADRSSEYHVCNSGFKMLQEDKTSTEIADECAEMMPVDVVTVYRYMRKKGYNRITEKDGTVKWVIFRQVVV